MWNAKQIVTASILTVAAWTSAAAQEQIPWITDPRMIRDLAAHDDRLVLLHFWREGCEPCKALENNVFNQPELIRVLSRSYLPVKINTNEHANWAAHYRVNAVPTDIIVDATGRELYRSNSPGDMNRYIAMLDRVNGQHRAGDTQPIHMPTPTTQIAAGQPPTSSPVDPGNFNPNGGQFNPAASAGQFGANPNDNQFATNKPTWNNDVASPLSQPQPRQPANVNQQRYSNPYVSDASSPSVSGNSLPNRETLNPSIANSTPNNQFNASPLNNSRAPLDNGYIPNDNAGSTPWANQNNGVTNNSFQPNNAPVQPSATGLSNNAPPNGFSPQLPPQNQLPPAQTAAAPSHPPIALDGFCPVTLVMHGKWVKGDPRFGAIHRGKTHLFASQTDQQRFLADADRYAPMLSGFDSVRYAETGQLVEGKRDFGVFYNDRYFLFADETSLLKFEHRPDGYVNAVKQAMSGANPQR